MLCREYRESVLRVHSQTDFNCLHPQTKGSRMLSAHKHATSASIFKSQATKKDPPNSVTLSLETDSYSSCDQHNDFQLFRHELPHSDPLILNQSRYYHQFIGKEKGGRKVGLKLLY